MGLAINGPPGAPRPGAALRGQWRHPRSRFAHQVSPTPGCPFRTPATLATLRFIASAATGDDSTALVSQSAARASTPAPRGGGSPASEAGASELVPTKTFLRSLSKVGQVVVQLVQLLCKVLGSCMCLVSCTPTAPPGRKAGIAVPRQAIDSTSAGKIMHASCPLPPCAAAAPALQAQLEAELEKRALSTLGIKLQLVDRLYAALHDSEVLQVATGLAAAAAEPAAAGTEPAAAGVDEATPGVAELDIAGSTKARAGAGACAWCGYWLGPCRPPRLLRGGAQPVVVWGGAAVLPIPCVTVRCPFPADSWAPPPHPPLTPGGCALPRSCRVLGADMLTH